MHLLLSDENFDFLVVELLREFGHDVVTLQDLGLADIQYPDELVLDKAQQLDRCVLTFNRKDFIKLHKQGVSHAGIVVCTYNPQATVLAEKIHDAISDKATLTGELIRIYRD